MKSWKWSVLYVILLMKTIEGYEGGCRWWFRTTSDKSEYKHNWQTREVLVMDLDFDILSHFCRHIKRMRDIKWRERERERQLRGLRNQRNSFHKSLEDKTLSLRNTHSSTREIIMSASHDWVKTQHRDSTALWQSRRWCCFTLTFFSLTVLGENERLNDWRSRCQDSEWYTQTCGRD